MNKNLNERVDSDIESMSLSLKYIINSLKCCGNCLSHDPYEVRGKCAKLKKLTHSCYKCEQWEYDSLDDRDRLKFELPKE